MPAEGPEALLFLGGLTANGTRRELEVGVDALESCGLPVHAVPGGLDRTVDRGRAWRARFGRAPVAIEVGGTRVLLLDTARLRRDPAAPPRGVDVGGLASPRLGRFELGPRQRSWLDGQLAALDASTPLLVASHVPLQALYAPWNWGVADGARALDELGRFRAATLLFGQVRSSWSTTTREGLVAHAVPPTARVQPPPRALCRALALEGEARTGRAGGTLVHLDRTSRPVVERVAVS